MKRFLYILTFSILMASSGLAEEKLVDKIVAEIDNEIITYKQLEAELAPIIARIESVGYSQERENQLLEEVKGRMLQNLIDEKIAEISAKRSKIVIDKEDVDNFLERVRTEQKVSMEEFEKALQHQGLTIAEYRDRLRKQILKKRLIDMEVRSKIVITDEAIKEYYESHPEEYGDKEEFHIWHITYPKSYFDPAKVSEVIDAAKKIRNIAAEKNNFKEISANIKEYEKRFEILSGDLGFFSTDDLSKEVNEVIGSLNKGDLSKVVYTSRGVQIFFIQDRVVSKKETLESATPKIRRILYNNEVEKRFEKWIKGLKENMHVRIIE